MRSLHFRRNIILISALIVFAAMAHLRNREWKSEFTLWYDGVLKSPDIVAPHLNLANELLRRGAIAEARKQYEAALAINPLDGRVLGGIAAVHLREGNAGEAARLFRLLVAEKPNEPIFHNNLGSALMRQGNLVEAEACFHAAIRLRPDFADPHRNLGLLYYEQGLLRDAADEFRTVLRLAPEHSEAIGYLKQLSK